MSNIPSFTVALPFLIIIAVYVILKYEQNHIQYKNNRELKIFVSLISDVMSRIDSQSKKSMLPLIQEELDLFHDDGKLSKITHDVISKEFQK